MTKQSKLLKIGFVAAATAAIVLSAIATSVNAGDQSHSIYRYSGNDFIVRKMPSGHGRGYVYIYRLMGTQWEEYGVDTVRAGGQPGGDSIAERIIRHGRLIGRVTVDLDNYLNTGLNNQNNPGGP